LEQLPTALHYLRKLGNGIVEQEDFEKECGIGKYQDLFGFSSWKEKPTQREILHLNEEGRTKSKLEKKQQHDKEEAEKKKNEEEAQQQEKLEKDLQEQLARAEKEARTEIRAEKRQKFLSTRQK